ncbi:MAG TPA: energy transducer TonB [Steroidobacteraceae bacterium]|jgi:protein TonB|nr:energy transducer TonB [Steroidobacteraceae bacterium]
MAVQILNDMPDAEVHRGEPFSVSLRELNAKRALRPQISGRAVFLGITIALHVVFALVFMQMQSHHRVQEQAAPIMASLLEEAPPAEEPPQNFSPPPMNVTYSLPTPDPVVVDTEIVATNAITATPMSDAPASTAAPPLVETVEYVRATPPVYPKESQRRREHGTVVLRVLVDAAGRPAQIQVEHSSGFDRLDTAAREAVAKFLFRPYEVNGVAQPAQVLIPIGFDRHAS